MKRALPPSALMASTASAPRVASPPVHDHLGAIPVQLLGGRRPDPWRSSCDQRIQALKVTMVGQSSSFRISYLNDVRPVTTSGIRNVTAPG